MCWGAHTELSTLPPPRPWSSLSPHNMTVLQLSLFCLLVFFSLLFVNCIPLCERLTSGLSDDRINWIIGYWIQLKKSRKKLNINCQFADHMIKRNGGRDMKWELNWFYYRLWCPVAVDLREQVFYLFLSQYFCFINFYMHIILV